MNNWDGRTEYLWAVVKRDGYRITVEKTHHGLVSCRSRKNLELDLKFVPSLKNAWLRMMPGETCTGELYCPGRKASYVRRALVREDTALRFEVFDVEHLAGHSLADLKQWCVSRGFHMAPMYDFDRMPAHDSIEDCEGWVFTDRVGEGVKWKPEPTADLVCTGFKDGNGQHLGLVGAVQGSLADGRVVAMVGGMTFAERVRISDDMESYLGRVFEVKYQYVGDGGRLRHPRFVRWRDDKSAAECTEEQLA